ncbi:MAG: ATP-binding cassette domain-containing protein [Nocardioidaceae bacterium]
MSWRPARRRTPVFQDLDLSIPAGQRVLVTGPSGAGKSTLLRAIAGLLLAADHGDLLGRVRVAGHPAEESAGRVGVLLQDPEANVVAETVGRDVAFGLENRQVPRKDIWPRVTAALDASAFHYSLDHPTSALSGGELQRLALAGSLVLDSSVLLLDEPTSMLDPRAAASVQAAVRRAVETRGTTTVIVEHHLEPWLDFADRLVVLGRGGEIVADGPPREVLSRESTYLSNQGVWVPGLPDYELASIDPRVVEPWTRLDRIGATPLIRAEDVTVIRRASLTDRRQVPVVALQEVNADLVSGQVLTVTGSSGAGKSTLVSVLAGLEKPSEGSVESTAALADRRGRIAPWRWRSPELAARLAWVPQIAEHGVVADTVIDEVLASSRACGRDEATARRRAETLLESLGLAALQHVNPYHLSGGEQRRLMLAAALVHGPHGLLLDEPTVGQDRATWAAVVGAISSARSAGSAVALATHDLRAVSRLGDDHLHLEAGRVR